MNNCDWCPKPLGDPADDNCPNAEHWATDISLGVRQADCGCCYVVDAVALEAMRSLLTPPNGGAT